LEKGGLKMKIADYLKKSQINLDLIACNKEEAIKKMIGLLKNAEEITDHNKFMDDIFERESLGTTGIGHDIAIPHARSDAVNDFVIVFGRVTCGLEFDALDKKPVKLIFLMGTPKEKRLSGYLEILSSLNRRLNKESFRNQLLSASAAEEIIEIFKKVEH